MPQLQMIETVVATGETLALDINQQDIPIQQQQRESSHSKSTKQQ